MNDLVGLSEPIKKLIEVISQGVGNVYKPHLIRKTADARAYEIRQIGSAIHDVRKLLGNADYANEELGLVLTGAAEESNQPLLAERATSHRQYREQVEQQNIEQITAQAAEELRDEKTISEEAVDPDWTARFFDNARHISNEEMQLIWGRILAGEVKRPNSYSLRTLEVLRNLSKNEAEIFVKSANLAIQYDNTSYIYYPSIGDLLGDPFGITFNDLLLLQELGLLHPTDMIMRQTPIGGPEPTKFVFGNTAIFLNSPPHSSLRKIHAREFTRVAQELLTLVRIEPDIRYIEMFGVSLKQENFKVTYGRIVAHNGDRIEIDNVQEIV